MVKRMLEDDREIIALYWPDGRRHIVGDSYGVTKLEVYGEPGDYGCVLPWIALWVGEQLNLRVPAGHVTIEYKHVTEYKP
jgi:hypothetical protein